MSLPPSGSTPANGSGPDGPLASIRVRTVVLAALIVVGIGLLFAFVLRFHLILFLFLVALILATVTRPAVEYLARRGVRPQIGIILVFLLVLLIVVLFAALVVPLIVGQLDTLTERLPVLYADMRAALVSTDNRLVMRLARGLPQQLPLGTQPSPVVPQGELPSFEGAWALVGTISRAGFVVVAIMALAFYWVTEGELITRRALFFVRPERREQVRIVWGEMEARIGGFFRGQLLLMGIVALFSGVGYLLVGVPYALGLALIAGICEAIPMIGPTLGMIPAVLVAITLAPDKLLWVILVGVAVQLLENNLFVPRVMDQLVGVNPIVTILAVVAFGALFGFVGALLAVPLAAMVQIIVQRLLLLREATPEVGRSAVSVLRLAARELAADVRKGATAEDLTRVTAETEQAEDRLENIAHELDRLLTTLEADA